MTLRTRLASVVSLVLIAAAHSLGAQADLASRADTSSTVLPRPTGPELGADRLGIGPTTVPDTVRRPRAIEYSDMYYTRLAIHRWASFAELPLFAAEWMVGQKLLNEQRTTNAGEHSSLRSAHGALTGGLEALFAVNTVTGLWNLYDSRHEPAGRTKRVVHSILMLAADAGFMYTASLAADDRRSTTANEKHRSAALTSMGIATVSTLMMWLWKN